MQGLITALLIIGNIFLSGCGSSQSQIATPQIKEPEIQAVAQETEILHVEEAQLQTNAIEIEQTLPVKPKVTLKKPRNITKDASIIAPSPNLIDLPPENTVKSTITVQAPVAAPVPDNWQPNEVHLIRANELITGLQREIGRRPNKTEMLQRLKSHMGLSIPQAEQVISDLDLK